MSTIPLLEGASGPEDSPFGPITVLPALPRSTHQMAFSHTESDVAKGLELLRRLIGPDVNPDHMWVFVHEGPPISKSRARYNRQSGRTYTPAKTVAAQESLEARFVEILKGLVVGGSVAIVAVFYRPNYQRIDADNLMKLVMDAGTKAGVWADDCYVTAQSAYIEMDRERPRTIVAFCQTESTLDRARMFKPKPTCQICGGPVSRREYTRCSNCSPKGRPIGLRNSQG